VPHCALPSGIAASIHRFGKPCSDVGLKYLVTEMVCWAAGGPQKYTGRSMAESHQELKITRKEWDAFMDDVWLTLDKFKVPAEEQAELRAIVNNTRLDIVFDPAHAHGAA
jgi:hemoglobin